MRRLQTPRGMLLRVSIQPIHTGYHEKSEQGKKLQRRTYVQTKYFNYTERENLARMQMVIPFSRISCRLSPCVRH